MLRTRIQVRILGVPSSCVGKYWDDVDAKQQCGIYIRTSARHDGISKTLHSPLHTHAYTINQPLTAVTTVGRQTTLCQTLTRTVLRILYYCRSWSEPPTADVFTCVYICRSSTRLAAITTSSRIQQTKEKPKKRLRRRRASTTAKNRSRETNRSHNIGDSDRLTDTGILRDKPLRVFRVGNIYKAITCRYTAHHVL